MFSTIFSMNLRLENCKSFRKDIFQDMLEQFPPEEMKSFEEFEKLFLKNILNLDIVFADDEMVGYVIYYKSKFLWIDYIAVVKKFHSKGFGSRILNLFFEKYKLLKGCYFEVEKENIEDINTSRRINFYKNLGCTELEFVYYFPNDIKLVGMSLFYRSFSKNIPSKEEVYNAVEEVFLTLHSGVISSQELLNRIYEENDICKKE